MLPLIIIVVSVGLSLGIGLFYSYLFYINRLSGGVVVDNSYSEVL
jgi:hypothetical protein